MPVLNILTNLPKTNIPKGFVDKIIPTLAKVLDKPEKNFVCVITGEADLHFHGDSVTPAAVARIESIGGLNPAQNQVITRHISDFVEKELGITPSRFLLTFYDLDSSNIAFNGTTIEKLRENL